MGEAKRRGTFEQRKVKAIAEMRVKIPRFTNLDAKPKGLVMLSPLTRWLVECSKFNAYHALENTDDQEVSGKDI